jgi:hypothetical protein
MAISKLPSDWLVELNATLACTLNRSILVIGRHSG